MPVELFMEPKTPAMSWDEFRRTKPPFSVALDGYVGDGPKHDLEGPYCNFNHHEGVSRMETRATCAQVQLAIRLGFFRRFRDEKGPLVRLYMNDCDQDIATSKLLFERPELTEHVINPLLNRLIGMEDMLDTTGGAFPYPEDMQALREMAWIYQPYTLFRSSGRIDRKEAEEYMEVVEDIGQRILAYISGHGKSIPLDTRFDRIDGGGDGWAMVREIGAQARTGMFAQGVLAFVSVRERPDGRWTYVIGKMSPYIRFNVAGILDALNKAEGCCKDCWGGATIIGGSPRVAGSVLPPSEVARIVESARGPR